MTDKIVNQFARPSDYVNATDARNMGQQMLHSKLDDFYFQIHNGQNVMDSYGAYVPPLRYPYYYIAFVRSGEANCSIDLTKFKITSNTVFFFHPKQLITLQFLSKKIDCFFINFSEAFALANYSNKQYLIKSLLFNKSTPPFFYTDQDNGEKLYQLFSQLHKEYTGTGVMKNEIMQLKLLEILFVAERLFSQQINAISKKLTLASGLVQQFKELIEKHYTENYSVSEYAQLLNVHPNHLNKVCKQTTGKTASQLADDRTILEAKNLLVYSTKNISEIAYQLGFKEPSYFFKFFRKQTGMPPSEYRLKPVA